MNTKFYILHIISKSIMLSVLSLIFLLTASFDFFNKTYTPDLLKFTLLLLLILIINSPILFYYELIKKFPTGMKRKILDIISLLVILLLSYLSRFYALVLFVPHLIILYLEHKPFNRMKTNKFIKKFKFPDNISLSELIIISIIIGLLIGSIVGYVLDTTSLYRHNGRIYEETHYNYFAFFVSFIISSGIIFIFLKRKYKIDV